MKKIILIVWISVFLISIFSTVYLAISAQDDPELISLDLKGMDIRDVLKILSQKSGLNIVADASVKGTVTLYIKDVSIMNALDIIVSTNNLSYEESGSLIRIMNDHDYELAHGKKFNDKTKTEIVKLNYSNTQEINTALAQMKTNIGKIISDDNSNTVVLIDTPENIKKMKEVISEMDVPLITEVFPLDYAKAELIKDKITEVISKGVGSVKFDERTNKLVIKDTQKKIEDIKKIIEAFDEKTREVVIDANIIQVTLSDKYSYGIDWANINKLGDITLKGDTVLDTGLSNATPSTLKIATIGATTTAATISLLKQYGETNVLSRPRITVADRQEAKILVGSKEVYVTSNITTTPGGTYNTADNVQFVDVGVRLGVTPQINRLGFITLKIKPEVSSTSRTVELINPDKSVRASIPVVTTSEAETIVVVKDNSTIIIAGLMKDTLINHKDKVPFLGDIPLMGKLFTKTGKSKEKTELVVFLTPHIIEGDSTTEEAKKYAGDCDKKAEEIKIEKPKEPEIKVSKIMPEQKAPVKTKEIVKNDETKLKKEPEDKISNAPVEKKNFAKTKDIAKKEKTDLKKEQPKPKPADKKKAVVKKNEQPVQKWAVLFGGRGSDEAKDIKEPEAKASRESSNAKATPYDEYSLEIGQEINDLAKQDKDVRGINGEVELQFTLDKEGFLIKGPIVLNNPDLRLVRSVVKIVKKASPFLPFPRALKKGQVDFNIVIRYE